MVKHPFDISSFKAQERKAVQRKGEEKRLEWNAALQERNTLEAQGLGKGRPAHQCICKQFEELLQKAGRLKNQGRLDEASLLCQKALCLEPENLELRQFISRLDARINAQATEAKKDAKFQYMNKFAFFDKERNSLPLTAVDRDHLRAKPQGRVHEGHKVQPTPQQYAAELRRQAAEAAQAKKERQRIEQEEEKLEIEAQQRLHAREKYKQHVGGGNDRLAWQRDMAAQAENQRMERRRRYLLDQAPVEGAAGSPLHGYGQLDKLRQDARGRDDVSGYAAYQGGYKQTPVQARSIAAEDGSVATPSILDRDQYNNYQHFRGHMHSAPRQQYYDTRDQHKSSLLHHRPQAPTHRKSLEPAADLAGRRPSSAPRYSGSTEQPEHSQESSGADRGSGEHGQAIYGPQDQQQGQEHYQLSIRPGVKMQPHLIRPRSAQYAYNGARAHVAAAAAEPMRNQRYGQVKPKEGHPGHVAQPRQQGAPYGVDHFVPEVRKGADLSPRAVAERQAQFVAKRKKKEAHERVGNRYVSPHNYKRPVDRFEVMAEHC